MQHGLRERSCRLSGHVTSHAAGCFQERWRWVTAIVEHYLVGVQPLGLEDCAQGLPGGPVANLRRTLSVEMPMSMTK